LAVVMDWFGCLAQLCTHTRGYIIPLCTPYSPQ
jgi:hypothetical protein